MITNVHMNSPAEIRFTLDYAGESRVRFVFVNKDMSPGDIARAIAENINHFVEMVDGNMLRPYNAAEHVEAIYRDAQRYGCD